MSLSKARMDFELGQMSASIVSKIGTLINREVDLKRDVVVDNLPRRDAFKITDLIRMKVNKLPRSIKMVEIDGILG